MTDCPSLTIRLNAADNVVVACSDLLPGATLPDEGGIVGDAMWPKDIERPF